MTLQDIINSVLTNKNKYSYGDWFDAVGKPICPLAVEIVGPYLTKLYLKGYNNSNINITICATELNCSEQHIHAFISFWDRYCWMSQKLLPKTWSCENTEVTDTHKRDLLQSEYMLALAGYQRPDTERIDLNDKK